jgi:cell cycle sensor histidine kinase DivJ
MHRWTGDIDEMLMGFVHPSVAVDRRGLHAAFIGSRLVVGAGGLAAMPLLLVFLGTMPSMAVLLVLAGILALVAAAFVVARTGSLNGGCVVSAAGFALVALGTGSELGLSDGALLAWLVLTPLDSLVFRARRALPATLAIAALASILAVGGVMHIATPAIFAAHIVSGAATLGLVVAALAVTAVVSQRSIVEMNRLSAARDAEALRAASVMSAFGDFVTAHDRNAAVVHAERGAFSDLALVPRDLIDRGLFDLIHIGDRPAFLKCVSDAVRSGAARATVKLRAHRRGELPDAADPYRVVDMRAQAVLDGSRWRDGRAALVVLTDVTERLAGERREIQLRRAAEDAIHARDRFLATISHELRTPLNAIIGFAEVLGGDSPIAIDEARRKEYAGIVQRSGVHLLELVNTLLDHSKIESGNTPIAFEAVDFAAAVANCLDILRLRAEQAGVAVVSEIEGDLPRIVSDGRACRQILLNILSNALKFTPAGGRILVCLRNLGDRIECAIEDSGAGIGSEHLAQLGQPFFRAATGSDPQREGTGLGLSIVRGLAALIAVRIDIDSALGSGTRVALTLPLDATGVAPLEVGSVLTVRERTGFSSSPTSQSMVRKRA